MAGEVKVAVVSGQLATGTNFADFTKSGFGAVKACIVIVGQDGTDDTSVGSQSRMSIGFSDFTNQFCIVHQDEDASAKVDCDALKSNTKVFYILDAAANIIHDGTASSITDGVRITNTSGTGSSQPFVTVIMFGGADLAVSLQRSAINSSQDGTATITHSGFTDGNDKLIFFIGSDISGEDSASSGINNSFGVCHATGSDSGGWTLVQRCMGWASDHGSNDGAPSATVNTDQVLSMITEAGAQDWSLEVTALSNSGGTWTVTTRDNGAGAGMEVYSLALDLDDRSAKVGHVTAPSSGTSWSPSVSLGFTPQYVGLGLAPYTIPDTIYSGAGAGALGISSNTGSGEETFHAWYNEDGAATTNTNNLFKSQAIYLHNDSASLLLFDISHSSFDSGGWTYTITKETGTGQDWFYWAIEEAAAAGEVIVAAQGSYSLTGQAVNTLWKHKIDAAQGAYVYTGQAAITSRGFKTIGAQGSYILTGIAALFPRTHVIAGDQGSYSLSGQASNLLWNHLMEAAQGAYNLTGFAATTSISITIVGAQGSYTYTGFAANLLWKHLVEAVQGSYALTGIAANTRVGFTMDAAQGSYNLTGLDALFPRAHVIVGTQGSYILTGQAVNLLYNRLVAAAQGDYILTGFDATTFVTSAETLTAEQGGYILTGQPVDFIFSGVAGGIYKPVYRPRRRS